MNCVELRKSLAEIDDGGSSEQQGHLKSCPACSALVAELNLITASAVGLRAAADPSPRVWNSIEIALRQEGLIRSPRPSRSLIPSLGSSRAWMRWMVPATVAMLMLMGLYVRQQFYSPSVGKIIDPAPMTQPVSDAMVAGLNDDDLLQEIARTTPAMQAQYADELRHVNDYIQDAKSTVDANPNDEEARRSLMEAYQEKAMLFELAMDRSLP
jgi:hypothetical protein